MVVGGQHHGSATLPSRKLSLIPTGQGAKGGPQSGVGTVARRREILGRTRIFLALHTISYDWTAQKTPGPTGLLLRVYSLPQERTY
jgi:hypothetical protein